MSEKDCSREIKTPQGLELNNKLKSTEGSAPESPYQLMAAAIQCNLTEAVCKKLPDFHFCVE